MWCHRDRSACAHPAQLFPNCVFCVCVRASRLLVCCGVTALCCGVLWCVNIPCKIRTFQHKGKGFKPHAFILPPHTVQSERSELLRREKTRRATRSDLPTAAAKAQQTVRRSEFSSCMFSMAFCMIWRLQGPRTRIYRPACHPRLRQTESLLLRVAGPQPGQHKAQMAWHQYTWLIGEFGRQSLRVLLSGRHLSLLRPLLLLWRCLHGWADAPAFPAPSCR